VRWPANEGTFGAAGAPPAPVVALGETITPDAALAVLEAT
jgi:hypothetical protein